MSQSDLLQKFIDSANAAIYLKDDQGRVLMVNRRVAEIHKVNQGDMIGKTDYDFNTKEVADKLREYDRQVAESGTPMTFEVTISLAEGKRTFIDHKFPVSNVEGSPKAVGGIAFEVTKK